MFGPSYLYPYTQSGYPQYNVPQYQGIQNATQYQGMQNNSQQGMTPPTVHADIVQVANEQEATNFPVAAGASQMMLSKDDNEIYIKTAYANGQSTLDVYVKRPPEPASKPVDMAQYVTRDELDSRLAAILSTPVSAKRAGRKEVEVSE